MTPSSLIDLLATGADTAPALSAPGRNALDFKGLRGLVADTLAFLNAQGIGRGDRVAIVLANGPEMAACFAACACGVASAPLLASSARASPFNAATLSSISFEPSKMSPKSRRSVS